MARQRRDTRGPLQRTIDNEAVARDQSYLDVITPEQAASGQYANHNGGRRYFRLTHLDRLHRNGKLTYEQHQAGTHYRSLFELGRYDTPRTMDLDRIRGNNVVSFHLPSRQQQARDMWRDARQQLHDTGFADRFLLRDHWPPMRQHHRQRALSTLRNILDTLAHHFRLT